MAIIRRMDLDADARLSKSEFIDFLKPDEPYSKMMKRNELSNSSRKKRDRSNTNVSSRRSSRRRSKPYNLQYSILELNDS